MTEGMRRRTVAFLTKATAQKFVERMEVAGRETVGPSVMGMNYVVVVWYRDGEQEELPLGVYDGPA